MKCDIGTYRSQLNPGFRGTAKNKKFEVENPGQRFLCPHCKKVLMEARAQRFMTRCKHCGWWVHLEKLDK